MVYYCVPDFPGSAAGAVLAAGGLELTAKDCFKCLTSI